MSLAMNRTAIVMLASGLDGVKNRMDPGEPVDRNIFKMSEREKRRLRIDQLPANLSEAPAHVQNPAQRRRPAGTAGPTYLNSTSSFSTSLILIPFMPFSAVRI